MPHELTPKEQVVRAWLEKASHDLESARLLPTPQPPILDTACFHCQQAAEKLIKALLIWHECEPPRTHSLEKLFDAALPLDGRLVEHRSPCERLSAYAVEIRYPDSAAEPTLEKAKAAFEAAESFFEFIVTSVPPPVRP